MRSMNVHTLYKFIPFCGVHVDLMWSSCGLNTILNTFITIKSIQNFTLYFMFIKHNFSIGQLINFASIFLILFYLLLQNQFKHNLYHEKTFHSNPFY